MNNSLYVSRDGLPDEEYRLVHDVQQIGRDPQCDIQIRDPGTPAHIATLEYFAGKYVLYNRSNSALQLDRRPLEAGQSSDWRDGQILEVGPALRLRLGARTARTVQPAKLYAEPAAPVQMPKRQRVEPRPAVEPAAEEPTATKPAKKSASKMQLAVAVLCFAAAAYVLLADDAQVAQSSEDSFLKMMQTVNHSWQQNVRAEPLGRLRNELQEAWVAEMRNRHDIANTHYDQIVRILLAQCAASPDHQLTGLDQQILDFVVERKGSSH